ncbi:hypothetical protein ACH79_30230 [Bradyrhizobium sp. CCBAU 051011]|uniref:hypothetical protein n=1 Tax=Bradyrhizobium sp. CCBAU 051011 TaxID=858422 RepID=UPI00137397CF|nr:hypothetical protein [Bradyrhizobium sp. CCBAU 051011]QHO76247.1 hypothetical protein ACH79_30230 [Bradyrhizobium sp. CCBAU 051011]
MSKTSRANKSSFPGRYAGELATPIYEPVAGSVGGLGGSKAEAERRAFEQRLLKMDQLFDWYSINPGEPDAWMYLAVRLASEHVPGMQVRHKRRGRKRTWKDGLGIELIRDVDALRQSKKMNYEQAIKELQKNKDKWRTYTYSNLITRDREARRVEQRRRRLAEQLMASPLSQAMGSVFGAGLTDENSSD